MTTKNNAEKVARILNNVIYRINQKMNLDSTTKKQISDFISARMTGSTQIEFTNELPSEGDFDHAEFAAKDYTNVKHIIHLLYGDNPIRERYPNILYVVIVKAPIKEFDTISEESEYVDEDKVVQESRFEVIVSGIIARIKTYLESHEISLDEPVKEQVEKFLRPLVDGKVWIITEAKITGEEGYVYEDISINNNTMKLAYAANVSENEFPNILYLLLDEMGNEARFRLFCEKRYIPRNISEQAIQYLDLSQTITIQVFERPGLWREMIKEAKNPIVIGQEYDSKTGNFRITLPIGYVEGNQLVLTAPNECLDNAGTCYIFN